MYLCDSTLTYGRLTVIPPCLKGIFLWFHSYSILFLFPRTRIMFVAVEMVDTVRIPPWNFQRQFNEAIAEELNKKLANKVRGCSTKDTVTYSPIHQWTGVLYIVSWVNLLLFALFSLTRLWHCSLVNLSALFMFGCSSPASPQVVYQVGLCICLYDITKLEDSYIFPGDGASHTKGKEIKNCYRFSWKYL